MRLRIGLLLLSLGILPLQGCNDFDSSTGPSSDPSKVGTVDFALPAALRAQIAGSADSLRVELRHGNAARSISVVLDSTAHVSDLEAGMWSISVGLYQVDGTLKYFGEDSVLIQPGKRSAAVVTLKPAKGSVDIVIRLDQPADRQPLQGTWYVSAVDTTSVLGRAIPLTFGDTGHLSGTDGCNQLQGAYFADPTHIKIPGLIQTDMLCIDSTYPKLDDRIRTALGAVSFWAIRDSQLLLSDSTGQVRLRYGRSPRVAPCTLVVYRDPVPGSTLVDRIETDTTGRGLVPLFIEQARSTDSGVWLTVDLPRASVKLHVFSLDSVRPVPAALVLDTSFTDSGIVVQERRYQSSEDLPQELLVAGIDRPDLQTGKESFSPVSVFVPWSLTQRYVRFFALGGGSFTLLPPGVFLQ